MKKEQYLKVTQKDLLEAEEVVVYSGLAKVDQTEIFYQETLHTSVSLTCINNKFSLKRKFHDAETKLNFKVGALTKGLVKTEHGDIILEIKTLDLQQEENKIHIYYEIFNQNQVISRFSLKWEWTNE